MIPGDEPLNFVALKPRLEMMRPVTEKICETLGCSQPAHQQRPIAPGTNLWLCAKCWEKMKQLDLYQRAVAG